MSALDVTSGTPADCHTVDPYCAGITAQLVRPDIRQSCILLLAVSSWDSHNPTTSRTTAIANPAIAPRRFPPCSDSLMPVSPEAAVERAAARY
jgi:hypothetical protein